MAGKPVLPQKNHFLIVEDDKGRKEISLTDTTYCLGRASTCDIRLRSLFISRHHAILYRHLREDGYSYYQIVDGDAEGKASANGLLVNGHKVSTHDLKDGDKVVFGSQVFAIYQYRQRDNFPTMPSNDPFDITLIDPAMMANEENTTELQIHKKNQTLKLAMANQTLGLNRRLYEYFLSTSLREPELLAQLRQETAQHPMAMMQIAPEQGQLMALLVQLMGAKKTLEVGVFTGYSALVIALALPPEGQVIACDVSEDYTAIARRYWQQAGVSDKIDLRIAPALETLNQLLAEGYANTFDFAFIDADKSNYDNYYEKVLALLRPGGLMAIDNVLWGGKVADPQVQDNRTQALRTLNQKIHQDRRVIFSLVPIADGLTLALKCEQRSQKNEGEMGKVVKNSEFGMSPSDLLRKRNSERRVES